jgi:excinuclease UvrABC ATPase subunit
MITINGRYLQDMAPPREVCYGKRFKDEVLAYHLNPLWKRKARGICSNTD